MSDTIDQQLVRLSELHSSGALTDDEFDTSKKTALSTPSRSAAGSKEAGSKEAGSSDGSSNDSGNTPTVEPEPISISFSVPVLLLISFILGGAFLGLGAEWKGVQSPAALIVCSGGTFHAGYVVAHSVAAKGVTFASTCVENGKAHRISVWLMFAVLAIEYMAFSFLVLLGIRTISRVRQHGRAPSAGAEA